MQTKKWIGLGAVIALLSIAISWFLYEQSSVYIRLCMSLDSRNIPFTRVEIQGHHYDVKFSLGSKFPLVLNKTALAQLEKKDAGKVMVKDPSGNEFELRAYQLEKITLGDLIFKDVLAVEMNEENSLGHIGRPLLIKYNLLFDFRGATFLMSNRFQNIKKAGYERESWVRVPLKIGQAGVVLQTNTDIGSTKLSLGLSTPNTMLKSSLASDTDWKSTGAGMPCFTSKTFMIGENEFGSKDLYSLPISNDEFSEMDGVLGMDFLYNHIVYLDFDNQCAHITK